MPGSSYPFNHQTTVNHNFPTSPEVTEKGGAPPAQLCPSPVPLLQSRSLCPGESQSRVGGRDVIPTGDKGCFHFWVAELQLCQAELSHIFPSAFFLRLLQAPQISPQMTAKPYRFGEEKRGGKGKHPVGLPGKPLPKEL